MHRLPVLRDRPTRDVDVVGQQQLDDLVIGQDRLRILPVDQFPDAMADGLGRMGLTAVGRRRLGDLTATWLKVSEAIQGVLTGARHAEAV